jgi:hypothetical protein
MRDERCKVFKEAIMAETKALSLMNLAKLTETAE